MSTERFIGEIFMFGGNFAPKGFAFCDGQLLPIAQNTALFSILGTTFGGDGRTTFGLPDFRGRAPMHAGTGAGPGLTPRSPGELLGTDSVTLSLAQIPEHNHDMAAFDGVGNTTSPEGAVGARDATGQSALYSDAPPNAFLRPDSVDFAGQAQPHDNRQPYLCVNFIIALTGIFPSRP